MYTVTVQKVGYMTVAKIGPHVCCLELHACSMGDLRYWDWTPRLLSNSNVPYAPEHGKPLPSFHSTSTITQTVLSVSHSFVREPSAPLNSTFKLPLHALRTIYIISTRIDVFLYNNDSRSGSNVYKQHNHGGDLSLSNRNIRQKYMTESRVCNVSWHTKGFWQEDTWLCTAL